MKINNLNDYLLYIQETLKDQLNKTNKQGYVLGISGGIDSALMLKILLTFLDKEQIHPFYIIIEDQSELADIKTLEKFCGIKIDVVDLSNSFKEICLDFKESKSFNKNNLKPKLRSMFLYNSALNFDCLVISCINYSEFYLGYFTKYGDGQGDVFPLSGLLKSDIYVLAAILKIPNLFLLKAPTPGFAPGLTDEMELGFSYNVLDNYLKNTENPTPANLVKIQEIHRKNLHKADTIKNLLFPIYYQIKG